MDHTGDTLSSSATTCGGILFYRFATHNRLVDPIADVQEVEIGIDFREVYSWFSGTIWTRLDCGKAHCGDAACCGHNPESGQTPRIYFLPGELAFLAKSLGHRLPMRKLEDGSGYHCRGNAHCVYDLRPIDCRTYPLWPLVGFRGVEGFIDMRGTRCPLAELPRDFVERLMASWQRLLLENPVLQQEMSRWSREALLTLEEVSDVIDWKR